MTSLSTSLSQPFGIIACNAGETVCENGVWIALASQSGTSTLPFAMSRQGTGRIRWKGSGEGP